MSFEDIETIWHSPHNRPSAHDLEAQRTELARKLRKRYRAFLLTIGTGITALVACSAALVRYALSGGALDLGSEWGSLLWFALPLIGAIILVRQYRQHRQRHAGLDLSISATLRAALDENRLERARLKVIGGLYAAMVLVFPIIIWQLLAAGKARPHEVTSMVLLFGAVVTIMSLALAYHYRRRLIPRKRELEGLLSGYAAGTAEDPE